MLIKIYSVIKHFQLTSIKKCCLPVLYSHIYVYTYTYMLTSICIYMHMYTHIYACNYVECLLLKLLLTLLSCPSLGNGNN